MHCLQEEGLKKGTKIEGTSNNASCFQCGQTQYRKQKFTGTYQGHYTHNGVTGCLILTDKNHVCSCGYASEYIFWSCENPLNMTYEAFKVKEKIPVN